MAADVVRIGHTVSLTGGASMWGQSEARAIDMLVKKINDAGGVLGKKIEVVRYDNRNDAVEAVNVAKRLVSDGVVAVIGPAQSGNSIASAPVLEKASVPMVVTTATNPYVSVPTTASGSRSTSRRRSSRRAARSSRRRPSGARNSTTGPSSAR